MTPDSGISFEEFARWLLRRLQVEPLVGGVSPDTSLFEDLALDSFHAFEMIIVIEERANLWVPPEELPEMFTVGDAYAYFKSAAAAALDEAT